MSINGVLYNIGLLKFLNGHLLQSSVLVVAPLILESHCQTEYIAATAAINLTEMSTQLKM